MDGEVELLVTAERMVLEVLGRVRPPDRGIVVGPVLDRPGWDVDASLGQLAGRLAADDVRVLQGLAGVPPEDPDDFPAVGDAVCAAARAAVPGAVDRDVLVEAAALRCFLAHDVAMALGSRACPLPEDLACGMLRRMEPAAARWLSSGVFRARLPLPAGHVSWRDRFLLLAGRDPHPFQ